MQIFFSKYDLFSMSKKYCPVYVSLFVISGEGGGGVL